MKLKAITIGAILLLSILVISAVPAIGINSVKADYGSATFCPNNSVEGLDTDNELYVSTVITSEIAYYIYSYYGSYYNYFFYGTEQSPIYPSDYSWALNTLQDNCDKITFFSKGHCTPWGYASQHYQLLCTLSDENNDHQAKDAIHIFPYTDEFECRLTFLWHCATARSYPIPPPYYDPDGPCGMPFCFTHNVGMTKYGTSGWAVFLGWNWQSPQFESEIPYQYPDYNWTFGHFAYFYYQLMAYGYSVNGALEELSWFFYNTDFQNCPLYNSLIVWGNGNMNLGY
ncbi:MAG: hypothetical protein QM398_09135 [Thermoproteota archaeon]|nr:hypothetical protein [Thermoproteota archaeon]NLD66568.1 hypothetical protein [Thermoproteota archaeon]